MSKKISEENVEETFEKKKRNNKEKKSKTPEKQENKKEPKSENNQSKSNKKPTKPEKKEEKVEIEEKVDKKIKNKKLLILIAIIVLIILVSVGGFFWYQYKQENKSVGTEWGDTYYTYLKEAISEDNNKEDYGLHDNMKNIELQFIEVGKKNPLMVMTYEEDYKEYVNIYNAVNAEKVDKIIYSEPADIEFLYEISSNSYSWYLHSSTSEQDSYKKIEKVLEKPSENQEADYTIKKDETTTQETLSGESITLSKFDETFVKPEIEDVETIDFSLDMEIKNLKENITAGVKEYKPQEKIVTKEIEKETKEQLTKLEETKKSMESAKEEIKKEEEKKAAEEERKKAEELARGLQVGSQTLKYGRYTSDVNRMDSSMYGTIILRPNGKFHIKANCEGTSIPYPVLDTDGTYQVTKVQNSYSFFDGLKFTTNNGVTFVLEAHDGNKLSDQWHGYNYVGNE